MTPGIACIVEVGGIEVEMTRKRIKNIHLRVYPDTGRVAVSAPARMPLAAVRAFVASKLDWIRRHRERPRPSPGMVMPNLSEPLVWGRPCRLVVQERQGRPAVALEEDRLLLTVRPGTAEERRAALIDGWYAEELRRAAESLIRRWEPLMRVRVSRITVRRMTSRWGSCTTQTGAIRINLELARLSPKYLEYLVVHEMVHLLEPSHNMYFQALMDRFLPPWRELRRELHRVSLVPRRPAWAPAGADNA
jgi:predicted metal-dependent hydrolase